MKIEANTQKFDAPLKATVAILGVTALVLGILSLLYQYDVVLALKGLGDQLSFSGAWCLTVVGATIVGAWAIVYFSSPKQVEKKQIAPIVTSVASKKPLEDESPKITTTKTKADLPIDQPVVIENPSYRMAPLNEDGPGKLAWAKNFCYAASTFFAIFGSGDYYKEDLLKTLKSDLEPPVRAFLEHLLLKVLNPMRSGVDVPLETMQECQKLVWGAGWKPQSKVIDDPGDCDAFRTFLLRMIGDPLDRPFMYEMPTHEMLKVFHIGNVYENQELALSVEHAWKRMIVRCIADLRHNNDDLDVSLQGPILFPHFTTLGLSRIDDSRAYYEDIIPFEEVISSYDVIPEEFRPPNPQILRLVSIVVHDPSDVHDWSYIRLQDGSWFHCDDWRKICKKVDFEEVEQVASQKGKLFNYEAV